MNLAEALAAFRLHLEWGEELSPIAGRLVLDEVERLQDEVTELGNKVIALRSAPREHCETCRWDGNDEMCSAMDRP